MFDVILQQIATIAVLVERTIQAVKTFTQYSTRLPKYQKYIDIGLSVVLSALACWAFNVDLLAVVGLTIAKAPFVGPILTGVVAGLGADVFHTIVDLLKMWRDGLKQPQA